ncbi:MAG TPA: MFS transporter [Planctomycetota bacterium]|nr:MFS transporter [Planctomycetota bacterium]
MEQAPAAPPGWITRTIVGIVAATFLSDFSHEMCTAVLPLYLGGLGLGAASLGLIEGVADFIVSLSKLAGGLAGHRLKRKQPSMVFGYVVTAAASAALGLVHSLAGLLSLRITAWVARGYRGPLRDFLLSEEVRQTHYGRAYGLERAGDMLGAVAGPVVAALLLWSGLGASSVLLWALIPGLLAAGAVWFLVKERPPEEPATPVAAPASRPRFPKAFWLVLVGVLLFGLGDFSRTFLVVIAARSLGETGRSGGGVLSVSVLLYAMHNLISAAAAYPVGRWADGRSKVRTLIFGYALGVATNALFAFRSGDLSWVVGAIVLSGVYIAIEDVVEKASVAQLLPRELRSLGLGILACGNALGDMASSVTVGLLLQKGTPLLAFGIPAAAGALGVLWLAATAGRIEPKEA